MLGLLARLPLARQHPAPFQAQFIRHLASSSSRTSSTVLKHALPRYSCTRTLPGSHRLLSFGSFDSISKHFKPRPTAQPEYAANLKKLQGDADADRHNVPRQVALFHALVDTGVKENLQVVLYRWESMCEFVRCTVLVFIAAVYSRARLCRIPLPRSLGPRKLSSSTSCVWKRLGLLVNPFKAPFVTEIVSLLSTTPPPRRFRPRARRELPRMCRRLRQAQNKPRRLLQHRLPPPLLHRPRCQAHR